jgi:hypothetical protein
MNGDSTKTKETRDTRQEDGRSLLATVQSPFSGSIQAWNKKAWIWMYTTA